MEEYGSPQEESEEVYDPINNPQWALPQDGDSSSKREASVSMEWDFPGTGTHDIQIKNHTATEYQGCLYVFGGYDGYRNHNTLHVFDNKRMCWGMPITKGNAPKRRNGHTATLVDNKIFIIGGWLGSGPLAADDLHVLDLPTLSWSAPSVSGKGPGSCNMHTADLYHKEIYIFRGGDGQNYLNDLHALNVETYIWKKVQAEGPWPQARANHSSSIIADKLYIFGGWTGSKRLSDLHILDLKKGEWSAVIINSEPPSPRAGMSLNNVRGKLVLFGGSGPSSIFFNDLQVFDPVTSEWITPILHSKHLPRQRAGHSATLVGQKLYIFGGSCGHDYLQDIWILDTDPPPQFATRRDPQHKMISSLAPFADNSELADVVFLVGGHKIFAHKIVLCLLSEKFRAMFCSGMKESRDELIELKDISFPVFTAILKYLYTGSMSNIDTSSLEFLAEVLKVADEFLIDDLKEYCEEELRKQVKEHTLQFIKEVAEMANAYQLKKYCQWFSRMISYKKSVLNNNVQKVAS